MRARQLLWMTAWRGSVLSVLFMTCVKPAGEGRGLLISHEERKPNLQKKQVCSGKLLACNPTYLLIRKRRHQGAPDAHTRVQSELSDTPAPNRCRTKTNNRTLSSKARLPKSPRKSQHTSTNPRPSGAMPGSLVFAQYSASSTLCNPPPAK